MLLCTLIMAPDSSINEYFPGMNLLQSIILKAKTNPPLHAIGNTM